MDESMAMNSDTLCEYIAAWIDRYPKPKASSASNAAARDAEAQKLGRFAGMTRLARPDAEELVEWKFQGDARRKARALNGVNSTIWHEAERRISAALQIAWSCSNLDLAPLMVIADSETGVGGWGPAMGSAALATIFPARFTVGDAYGLASLRALHQAGVISQVLPGGRTFTLTHWEPYLDACRWIAGTCRRSLREIDQALWAANGAAGLPPPAPSPNTGPRSPGSPGYSKG